ncbi:MAG TPA: DUF3078 domain-containing protein [Flavitalea sp.]|nr:DUF3078 domain-containing protein [Flavitalea sp.]
MKKIFFLVMVMSAMQVAYSQDNTIKGLQTDANKKLEEDTTFKKGWKKGGFFTLNLAQGALSNWQGGGDKSSFSVLALTSLYARFKEGRHRWDNTLDLGYGIVNTTSLGSRKSDDRIDLLSKYGYQLSDKWFASGLFNFRTQFAKGYSYEKDAAGNQVPTLTSNFMAPAYVLISAGFDFKPTSYFSLFLSPLTERFIIVGDDYLSSVGAFGVDSSKHVKNELGAFLSAEFNKEILTNVTYKARFDAFSNYKSKPGNIDIFWTNLLALKVNKYLSANIALDFLYDDDAIARMQIRELLGIGFSATF